jgi:hypothetical protein
MTYPHDAAPAGTPSTATPETPDQARARAAWDQLAGDLGQIISRLDFQAMAKPWAGVGVEAAQARQLTRQLGRLAEVAGEITTAIYEDTGEWPA